jgi:16S rRNA (cytosine1402-N4)-methyltransferase
MVYHVPVLLDESIEGLNIKPNGTYVDLTFGGGGHSSAILQKLSPKGKLFGFDQDEDAIANAPKDKRFTFVRGNFRYFRNFLRYNGVLTVDGILADLGVSSHHFDSPERGFSFRHKGPLDMRMNPASSLSAAKVVNTYSQEKLVELFKLYGELPNAFKVAQEIAKVRQSAPIETVEKLFEILGKHFPQKFQNKMMAQTFQALRIEVNSEMEVLKQMLLQTPKALKSEGRLVVISYHSLEDRLVKNFIKSGNFEGKVDTDFYGNTSSPLYAVNRKVIVPSDEENDRNSRARSAKLRIALKV